jgi:hypothetical protein
LKIYYYLSVFPLEALVASQLSPMEFGTYMAIGSTKSSHENFIFMIVEGEFAGHFDWDYARERCIPHEDGGPKRSLYLSVYRVLESIPFSVIGNLYLVTRAGRCLELSRGPFREAERPADFFVYQELCPLTPLVASSLPPPGFAGYLTGGDHKISVPKIVFADLKVADFSDHDATEHLGGIYDRKRIHLKSCIDEVVTNLDKKNKTVDRSHVDAFTYKSINRGVYLADSENFIMYPMKSLEELKSDHYYWAKSADIL